MITKFEKYNESIKDLLVGPTKEEVWKNLGYDIPFDTPKEFISYLIDGIKIKEQTKYPNSILWSKNGKTILLQDIKIKYLYVDYDIWKIFQNIFGMKKEEIESLIINTCENKLNITGFKIVIGEINKM